MNLCSASRLRITVMVGIIVSFRVRIRSKIRSDTKLSQIQYQEWIQHNLVGGGGGGGGCSASSVRVYSSST